MTMKNDEFKKDLPLLVDAICEGWTKSLTGVYGDGTFSSAVDGFTDCNRFVHYVCDRFGYKNFVPLGQRLPMLANSMFRYMESNGDEWFEVDGANAQRLANMGGLVVAAQENLNGHGHVCVVRPGTLTYSGKWLDSEVPKVANVSVPNLCRIDRGANYAFSDKPQYFVLRDKK